MLLPASCGLWFFLSHTPIRSRGQGGLKVLADVSNLAHTPSA